MQSCRALSERIRGFLVRSKGIVSRALGSSFCDERKSNLCCTIPHFDSPKLHPCCISRMHLDHNHSTSVPNFSLWRKMLGHQAQVHLREVRCFALVSLSSLSPCDGYYSDRSAANGDVTKTGVTRRLLWLAGPRNTRASRIPGPTYLIPFSPSNHNRGCNADNLPSRANAREGSVGHGCFFYRRRAATRRPGYSAAVLARELNATFRLHVLVSVSSGDRSMSIYLMERLPVQCISLCAVHRRLEMRRSFSLRGDVHRGLLRACEVVDGCLGCKAHPAISRVCWRSMVDLRSA